MSSPNIEGGGGGPLYGPQTQYSVINFPGRGRRLSDVSELVRAFAHVKSAAAWANGELGVITPLQCKAIQEACAEMASGALDAHFPSPLVQGGGGTSTNMNVNEVVAARAGQLAGEPLHPNDQVNASQSTNDTYPTAMALALAVLATSPAHALRDLADAFDAKAVEYNETLRLGRTCLQDAVTLTVGDTHRGHARAIRRAAAGLEETTRAFLAVPLGATVLGTGIGAPAEYRDLVVAQLARLSGLEVTGSPDLFDALANLDGYASAASAGARAAMTMAKIAADLRFLSSGPVGGIGEVVLPTLQAGSSIMPSKVNPVIPEYVMQLSFRIRGSAHTVESAVAAGELELNIMEPIIVDSLVDIFEDLTASANAFAQHCIAGLTWDGPRLQANLNGAFDRWVELAAEQGYDTTTQAVRASRNSGEGVSR